MAVFLAQYSAAFAFPFIDPTNQDTVPTGAPAGTELPAQDVQGLRNQLRLANPGALANGTAWTIIPRLTIQEMFTDNAYELSSPRRPDAITVVAPGITIAADTARLQLNLDYQPNILLHAINGPLNVITQQLNAIGLVTVVPDLAYVDVRALSGVQSQVGALTGGGAGGDLGGAGANPNGPQGGAGQGLNRNNEVQTSSFGISPYLLKQFGDYGTGKIGASVNAARYSQISGFAASPLPTNGSNGASVLTTEQIAHYETGEFLDKAQWAFDVDFQQSHNVAQGGPVTVGNTTVQLPGGTFDSRRQTITNSLTYALLHSVSVSGTIGEQDIHYTGGNAPNIHGLTWNIGLTYTPTPDSSATVTYGHINGANSFGANAHFTVGGRSIWTFSYSNTVGTQLENLQNQLNNSAAGLINGQGLINAQTGAAAIPAANQLGVQNGVFRFNTATTSWTTTWLRDTLQATLTWSEQTSLTPGFALSSTPFTVVGDTIVVNTVATTNTGPTTDITTAMVNWSHDLSPDMVLNSSVAYSFIRRNAGVNDNSIATAVSLQYTLSPTTTMSARYSFFDRTSKIPGYSLYENILLLGITKHF